MNWKFHKGLIVAVCFSFFSCSQLEETAKREEIPPFFDGVIKQEIMGQKVDFIQLEKKSQLIEQNSLAVIKKTTEEINQMIKLGKHPELITYENSFAKLDAIYDELSLVSRRLGLIGLAVNDKELREKAKEFALKIGDYGVELSSRKDLFKFLEKAKNHLTQSGQIQKLSGEDKKFIKETMISFKRMGLSLDQSRRDKIIELFKKLNQLTKSAEDNIASTNNSPIFLTKEEIKGVNETIISHFEKDDQGRLIVRSGVTYQYKMMLENAPLESTRKKVFTETLMRTPQNLEIARDIFNTRAELARLLGYSSWAQYQTAILMVKNAVRAKEFIHEMSQKIDSKFRMEIATLRNLKVQETGDHNAKIEVWDIDYYKRLYQEKIFNIDQQQLKNYFTLDNTLQGMIAIYEKLFHIKIDFIEAPEIWDRDVQTLLIKERENNQVLGLIYLDFYPRPEHEKYGHFANVTLRQGMRQSDGTYRHPITSLICNFPKGVGGEPSLLSYYHVKTLFHEFGHAMHVVLTKTRRSQFSGTSVARDFVEAPSQMLENWVKNKEVLDTFAFHYKDKTKKIPKEIIDGILAMEKSTIALFYRAQFAYAMMDQILHQQKVGDNLDPIKVSQEVLKKYYLPYPEGSQFILTFGHLFGGYDARYYGYAWADSIATDMATAFKSSPKGFLDEAMGLKLRREIYEQGSSRDENESVAKFLGRKQNSNAFVNKLLGKN